MTANSRLAGHSHADATGEKHYADDHAQNAEPHFLVRSLVSVSHVGIVPHGGNQPRQRA
jgi:hypothetical protein